MPLHLVLVITIVVAIAFYISMLNPISIDFNLTRNVSYEIPLVVVVLAAIFIGSLLVALMDAVRASRQGISRLRALAQDKRSLRLHQPYERGLQYLEAGYPRDAEEEFGRVLEKDPKHVPSLIELGKIKSMKGEHEEALKLHNRALMLDNENLEAAFCVAEDYARRGRYQKARSVLESTRRFVCNELVTLAKLREVCMDGQLWEDALKVQREIVHLTKDKGQVEKETTILNGIHHELGQVALEQGRNSEALKEFKTILKTERHFVPAYAGMGDAYLAMGKENEALKAWEEGYSGTSCPSLLKKQEDLFMRKDDPGSAISLYKAALEAGPRAAALGYLLGLVYLKLEMTGEALQEFKKVQAAGIIVPGMGSIMASIYERTGEKDLAAREYRWEMEHAAQSLALFKCASCGEASPAWKGRCSHCGQWNTYRLNMEKGEPLDEKVVPPPAPGF